MKVAMLNPGAMGAAIGSQLVNTGHQVVWLPEGRGAATHARAESAGMIAAHTVADCDMVLSVVPPAAAADVARSVSGFTGLFVDLNAIAPDAAAVVQRIAERGGATAVDGAVVGPPPVRAGTTRVFVSGDHAQDAAAVFGGSIVEAIVLDAGPTAASALKMAYGSWTKGSAALLLSAHATAQHYGVDTALDEEWRRSQPALPSQLRTAQSDATQKGWRWVAEMRANAEAFSAAGQPPGFGDASASVYAEYPRPDIR